MSFSHETVDPLDLDDYLDFNRSHGSPMSNASHTTVKAIRSPEQTTPRARQSLMKQNSGPGMFAGPSHQYDMHKQQTGLPVGGLASTIAANRQAGYAVSGFPGSNFGMQDSADIFDFNAMPANPSAFGGMTDMDMDFTSPVDGFPSNEFVDPHTIVGRDTQSPPPREAVRMYPGMHSQQAAVAKQQQQQEIQRQQQMKASQQQQQQQPQQGHSRQASKPSNSVNKPSDPLVEERISRLLNQMRQGSVGSNGDSQQTQSYQRSSKREEDMDEDEKLLASEEGKKLTSKERRQLRNKVSARAFRSRRKEYIGQLEGELTAKQQENDDLHAENEALRSENMRLTDLSKMLLSSPAFSTFLNDLSANGAPGLPAALAQQQQRSLAAQMSTKQQKAPKDANPHQSQILLQQQQQMPTVPEQEMDFSNLDANGSWGVGMDFGFDQQVFAVTELPEAPLTEAIDTSVLSGKSSFTSGPEPESKLALPAIQAAPVAIEPAKALAPVINESVTFDSSNPAYELFAEAPAPVKTETPVVDEPVFGTVSFGKATECFEITVDSDGELHAAAMARFEALSSRLHELATRVEGWTPSE